MSLLRPHAETSICITCKWKEAGCKKKKNNQKTRKQAVAAHTQAHTGGGVTPRASQSCGSNSVLTDEDRGGTEQFGLWSAASASFYGRLRMEEEVAV